MRIYRVVVRGQFDGLDEATRSRLLAEADDHEFLKSAFTADGTLTYDRQLVAFNFRYEVRQAEGDDGSGRDGDTEAADAVGSAVLERTRARLEGLGIGHKRLRATVTDMATMWH